MSTDRFIEAVYRAILGREPDPEGLQGRSSYFRNADYPAGVERTIRALLGSPEFLAKQQAFDDLDIEVLSPSTRERSVARGKPLYPIVLVRFRLLPQAIPTFYLEASDTDTQPRVLLSLRYLNDIISNFICGSSHFHMFAEEIDHEIRFVAQITGTLHLTAPAAMAMFRSIKPAGVRHDGARRGDLGIVPDCPIRVRWMGMCA